MAGGFHSGTTVGAGFLFLAVRMYSLPSARTLLKHQTALAQEMRCTYGFYGLQCRNMQAPAHVKNKEQARAHVSQHDACAIQGRRCVCEKHLCSSISASTSSSGRQIMSMMRHSCSVPPTPLSDTLAIANGSDGSLGTHWKSATCACVHEIHARNSSSHIFGTACVV